MIVILAIGFFLSILFGIYDYIRYHWYLTHSTIKKYRIEQITIHTLICFTPLLIMDFSHSVLTSLVFMGFWWFGFSDYVFYVIGSMFGRKSCSDFWYYYDNYEMEWLYFTPIGLIKLMFGLGNVTKKEFLIMVIISFFIVPFFAFVINYYFL